jgi:murein tripeptide amidase MpaA
MRTTHLIGSVLLVVWLAGVISAAERYPYKAMGAPSDPQVIARWDRYHDYQEATRLLKQLAHTHAEHARLKSLGKSYDGREMWLMTITSFDNGQPEQKAGFWIDGGIHANEIQGTEVALYTAWYLLEMYDQAPKVKELLDTRVFYIVPMMSPDSRDAHFHAPNTTNSPRSGQRPVDDDRDGLVDEDGPDDLNGDGQITQMRVRDPNGRWKPNPDYPNWMVRVKPGARGEYTLLGSEGYDNDGDGRVNEDGDGYYDPNRDWAWKWQPASVQRGAFRYPFSIQENRLVADCVTERPNIAGSQSYHNAGGMILRSPGAKADRVESSDLGILKAIGDRGAKLLPGYRSIDVANDLYEVFGGELDWFYYMRGVLGFTNELFTSSNFYRTTERGENMLESVNKYLLLGEGVVAWTEVDHPQYGKVEVGGKKKNWGRQPPSFLLEEECHRNMAFTLYHADQMPQVQIQSIDVKPLAEGLQQVTAVVENKRLIPTRSAIDVKHRITPPDRVALDGKDIHVITGLISTDGLFRAPREQQRQPAEIKLTTIPGHGVVYVRWLVQGQGPYRVTLTSVKGGVDRRSTGP